MDILNIIQTTDANRRAILDLMRTILSLKKTKAWMVKALRPGAIGTFGGKLICADKLNKPEYWRE
ncbi:MAG: hypothetical protein WBN03_22245 [Desulfobacterales bacterium]